MGWGDALTSAWDAATDTARAAANAVADSARAAYDYVANRASEAYDAAADAVGRAVDWIVSGFGAIADAFSRAVGGDPVQPCPRQPNGGGGGIPGGRRETPQPVDDYNIVSVDWLDGDDVTIIGACEQFVNLPRDAKWLADSGIANIDRLSINPRLLVKFDKPVSAGFRWRIVPVAGGSPAYTAAEEGRNHHFKASPTDWASGSVSDGKTILLDAQLVAGGGYKFQIEAKDDKEKLVKSGIITTKRLFWYVELPMTGLANALTSTASVEAEFAMSNMVLKQLPDLAIAHQENIGSDADSNILAANVNTAIAGNATASAKAPYLLRITYTDHLAVKNPNQRQRRTGMAVGPGRPAVAIGVTAPSLGSPPTVEAKSLWNDLVTGESWFVDAWYTPDGGGAAVQIPPARVTASGSGSDLGTLSVDVTGLAAGTGTVDVFVDVVDRMRAGLAFGGAADICVCTIAWWTPQSQTEQAGVVVHEAGHKVQMVVDGTGTQPDRVATQYDQRGHRGSHCHNGAPAGEIDYDTSANIAASNCVMFGGTNGHNSFCGNCGPAVNKVDIGSGF